MRKKSNIVKYTKRKDVNVAVIVFLIIFIYVIIHVGVFLRKDHLSMYEVKEGYTSDHNTFTGIIIRQEEVVHSEYAGYVNYFFRDGDRVGKLQTVYSISDLKNSSVADSNSMISLTAKDVSEVKKEVSGFQRKYSNIDFYNVYDFKYELDGLVLQLTNDNRLSNMAQTENGSSDEQSVSTGAISTNNAANSGVITYTMDGMEGLKLDDITKDSFNRENYNKTSLRTLDIIERESPVYRLVKSDKWKIVISLTNEQYDKMQEKERIKIKLEDTGLEVVVPIEFTKNQGEPFAVLSLDKYMIQFINQRYINIELESNVAKGLKIPVSSIVEKEFFMVPLEYFTSGGDSNNKGVVVVEDDLNTKETTYNFTETDIYYSDEEYQYIDGRLFDNNTWLYNQANGERYRLGLTATLKGVFNVNKGYAVFRKIDVLYENEEYCIIAGDTSFGLSVYDHIALVGKTAVEQAIIY